MRENRHHDRGGALAGRGRARVELAHGGGGRRAAELVAQVFAPAFGLAAPLEDSAVVSTGEPGAGRLAITTDACVARPRFFPGGDLGRLAIAGAVNDLAVGGAEPRWISAAFVIEEGVPIAELAALAASMRRACDEAEVALVAGDTKVVERGKGDGVFVATTGVGVVPPERAVSIAAARPGDAIVVSGPLGEHGAAMLAARPDPAWPPLAALPASDVAPVAALVRALLAAVPGVRAMRDPTSGGLASAVCELAEASRVGVRLYAEAVPFRPEVRAACEAWGLDPLHLASAGRIAAVVPRGEAERAVAVLARHRLGRGAAIVGECVNAHSGVVVLASRTGEERAVAMPAGEPVLRSGAEGGDGARGATGASEEAPARTRPLRARGGRARRG